MSTARRSTVQPIIIERRPDAAKSTSNIAPSTPPSPKNVRFAPQSTSSRPLSSTEAWSLYHFECHARTCPDCDDPYKVYRKGRQLCLKGHSLAQDVALHVYYKDGDIFGQSEKLVRVELPHNYDQVRSLLKGMEHYLGRRRTTPTVTYDKNYPVQPRKPSEGNQDKPDIVVQPAKSDRKEKRSEGKSKHKSSMSSAPPSSSTSKSSKYRTVIIEDDDDDSEAQPAIETNDEKRGSLYLKDRERRRKEAYRVEVREPERKERRRRSEDRKSGYYA